MASVGVPVATTYVLPLSRGGSEPHVLTYDDGMDRVTKFKNNPQGAITLVNELVVARIAEYLQIPAPEGTVVYVGQELIDAEPQLRRRDGMKFDGGLCFGSEYLLAIDALGRASIDEAHNKEDIAGIVLLDTLCENTNRNVSTNLLIASKGEAITIMSIDHGHCFHHDWTARTLDPTSAPQIVCHSQLRGHVSGFEAFSGFLGRLHSLDRENLIQIVHQVPSEWGVSQARLEQLADYILGHASGIEEALKQAFP
jgi:hypothetical protein